MLFQDSLTKEKVTLDDLDSAPIAIYICGPTLYRNTHIGNYRGIVYANYLISLLHLFHKNAFVFSNITDIGTKKELNLPENLNPQEMNYFIQKFAQEYFNDLRSLKLKHNIIHYPASNFKRHMADYALRMVKNGHVDAEEDGLIMKRSFIESNKKLLIDAGSRLDPFYIWRGSNDDGIPGWHIECSTIISEIMRTFPEKKTLLDIHIGGFDLKDIHHNAEIICQKAIDKKPLSRFWLHNGPINLNGKKMSKSTGNVIDIKEIINKYNSSTLKILYLHKDITSEINITNDKLEETYNIYLSLIRAILKYVRKISINQDFLYQYLKSVYHIDALAYYKTYMTVNWESPSSMIKYMITTKMENQHDFLFTLLLNYILGTDVVECLLDRLDKAREHSYIIQKMQNALLEENYKVSDDIRNYLIKKGFYVITIDQFCYVY